MEPDWQLRSATEQDVDAVLGIAERSPSAPQWTTMQYRRIFAADAKLPRLILLAEQAGVAAGFAVVSAICSIAPAEAELENIAVEPACRGQGLGRALLEAACTWAALQGAAGLRLEVRAGNSPALRLYQAAGFVRTASRPRYYAAPVEDAVCMERAL